MRDPGRSFDPLRDLAIPDSKEVSAMAANISLADDQLLKIYLEIYLDLPD